MKSCQVYYLKQKNGAPITDAELFGPAPAPAVKQRAESGKWQLSDASEYFWHVR